MYKRMILSPVIYTIFIVFLLSCSSEKRSPDLVEMPVDFSWSTGNIDNSPELHVSNVPLETKQFNVTMIDLSNNWEHGDWDFPNDNAHVIQTQANSGLLIIRSGAVKGYKGPGGSYGSARYEFTVKAIDPEGVIVGIGKKMRRYPEEEK
jgi:phosphatidylethanolamine-binding protein (PEBP) family uncharacterized protein